MWIFAPKFKKFLRRVSYKVCGCLESVLNNDGFVLLADERNGPMLTGQLQAEAYAGELVTEIDFGVFGAFGSHDVEDGILQHDPENKYAAAQKMRPLP